jgi:hypothetical protein
MFRWKKRYSIEIPELIHERFQEEADKRGITSSELIQEVFKLGFISFKMPMYIKRNDEFIEIELKGDK